MLESPRARLSVVISVIAGFFVFPLGLASQAGDLQGEQAEIRAQAEKPQLPPRATNSTTDHSKLEALKGPFRRRQLRVLAVPPLKAAHLRGQPL